MKRLIALLCIAGGLLAQPLWADTPVELGRLSCQMSDAQNRVLVTNQTFDCTFERLDGSKEELVGEIRKVGVDLSLKSDLIIVWTVALVKGDPAVPASIAGTYVGVSADVAAGAGMGARVLLGGGDDAISLTPLSISGVAGAGASLGLTRLRLSPAS